MGFDQTLLLIYTIATVAQAVVVAITLMFIYRQAVQGRKSVENLEKTLFLQTYINHRSQLIGINKMLLDDERLSNKLGLSRDQLLCYIIIGWA
jgi:cell division protein FtsL